MLDSMSRGEQEVRVTEDEPERNSISVIFVEIYHGDNAEVECTTYLVPYNEPTKEKSGEHINIRGHGKQEPSQQKSSPWYLARHQT